MFLFIYRDLKVKISRISSQSKISSVATPLFRGIELIVIAFILITILLSRIESVSFHHDESSWIATSYYSEAFVSGDFVFIYLE